LLNDTHKNEKIFIPNFFREKKYPEEAYWYGKYYALNQNATNVELLIGASLII